MDALAVKQACKFAKEHALKNGPIVSLSFLDKYYSTKYITSLIALNKTRVLHLFQAYSCLGICCFFQFESTNLVSFPHL